METLESGYQEAGAAAFLFDSLEVSFLGVSVLGSDLDSPEELLSLLDELLPSEPFALAGLG